MEPFEGNEMTRKPLQLSESLIDHKLLKRLPFMVLTSVIVTFSWFLFRWNKQISIDLIRSETFTLLAFCQWFNVLNCRSATQSIFGSHLFKNRWLWGGLLISIFLQMIVIYWPPLSKFFHTLPIEGKTIYHLLLLSSLVLWVEEGRKLFLRLTKLKD
jgi:Ca2+-transporting ATPase